MSARTISLLDFVVLSRWFQDNWRRRAAFAVLLAILLVLSVFPRVYEASVKLAPQESNTAGLSAILSQLGGNYAALLGRSQPVEVDLAVARSFHVKRDVVRRLGIGDDKKPSEVREAILRLDDRVDVRAMRGNLMEISVRDRDPDQAIAVASAYADAMQQRLAELSREATTNKRKILNQRFADAQDRLTRAENAVNSFRRINQLASPETQLTLATQQLSTLQGQLQAKQVQLQTALQFGTPQSVQVQALQAELRALQGQVDAADRNVRTAGGLTAAGIAPKALYFERLNRELKFSQALYDSYARYLEGAAIEDMTADYGVMQIEPPFLAPELQFNLIPLALLVVVILFGLVSEFIVMRPPPGSIRTAA